MILLRIKCRDLARFWYARLATAAASARLGVAAAATQCDEFESFWMRRAEWAVRRTDRRNLRAAFGPLRVPISCFSGAYTTALYTDSVICRRRGRKHMIQWRSLGLVAPVQKSTFGIFYKSYSE